MKLNRNSKVKIRNIIIEDLSIKRPEKLIHLDKEIIEFLLFDEYIIDNKKAKFITWSGDFLRYFDLSEVSFEDVVWNTSDSRFKELNSECYNNINLSQTNSVIDLSKSFSKKHYNKIDIYNCNFYLVDLSNNDISDCEVKINLCNLSSTGLKLDLDNNQKIKLINTDFSFNNLNKFTLSEVNFGPNESNIQFFNCNLSNTGLNIRFNNNFKTTNEKIKVLEESNNNDIYTAAINKYKTDRDRILEVSKNIKAGNLEGCYINNKRIPTRPSRAASIHFNANKYKKLYMKVLGEIKRQIYEE